MPKNVGCYALELGHQAEPLEHPDNANEVAVASLAREDVVILELKSLTLIFGQTVTQTQRTASSSAPPHVTASTPMVLSKNTINGTAAQLPD